jgi:hypothetical protein
MKKEFVTLSLATAGRLPWQQSRFSGTERSARLLQAGRVQNVNPDCIQVLPSFGLTIAEWFRDVEFRTR